jgi:diaminohydroxyphosphoribosylaminopyrimidine deaminase / 5-amino-6-(5-phosphoribosylamino)uracil reductase
LPDTDGRIAPGAILDALFERGLRRILIEGGAQTVSSFLSAGCLDRLHIVVAPMILGSGKPGLDLPPIADMTGALRIPIRTHSLGPEVLFDCDLTKQRTRA